MPDPHGATRILHHDTGRVRVVGLRRRRVRDLYHGLLNGSWLTLAVTVVVLYLGANAAFAMGYLALGDGIENARPGSFVDAFFIVGARLSLMLVRNETTAEGEIVRRVHDLPLRRDESALFGITWTAEHLCTPGSPLHGIDEEALASSDAELVVSLTGLEEGLSQTVHAHHVYRAGQIRWDARFVDLLVRARRGQKVLDFRRFHDAEPLAALVEATPSARRR